MENSLACLLKARNFNTPLLLPGDGDPSSIPANCYNRSLTLKRPWWQSNKLGKAVMNCSKLEKKWGNNEIINEEELMGSERFREKCKETINGGIPELLECLEREAIMGEDEGKEPTDYNRRAQIFEQSSRVFQAIKESTA